MNTVPPRRQYCIRLAGSATLENNLCTSTWGTYSPMHLASYFFTSHPWEYCTIIAELSHLLPIMLKKREKWRKETKSAMPKLLIRGNRMKPNVHYNPTKRPCRWQTAQISAQYLHTRHRGKWISSNLTSLEHTSKENKSTIRKHAFGNYNALAAHTKKKPYMAN